MKIYVITKGDYSDYNIYAVATDKKKAEKLKEIFTDEWDGAEIEEYDDECFYLVLYNKTLYNICFNDLSTDYRIIIDKVNLYSQKDCNIIELLQNYEYKYQIEVLAKNKEHALKIARDKFAEYKYNNIDKE